MKTCNPQSEKISRKLFTKITCLLHAVYLLSCLVSSGTQAQTFASVANKELNTVYMNAPALSASNFEKGVNALSLNDEKSAIRFFSVAISENKKDAASLNKRGCAYAKLKQWKNAKADFISAIAIDSNSSEYFYNLGLAENKTEHYTRSIIFCTKAIEINPSMAEAFLVRGISEAIEGDENSSMSDFKMAIAKKPDYAEAYYNIGLNYYEVNDDVNAKKYLKEAIQLGFENPELARYLKD